MLNKGLRDQESIRIDNILKMLHSLTFVPKFWNIEDTSLIDNQLTDFDLTTLILDQIEENNLIQLLDKYEMDWTQKEQFADFLVGYSINNQFDFRDKAIAIYNHIQKESKVFSFGIFNKLAAAKASL